MFCFLKYVRLGRGVKIALSVWLVLLVLVVATFGVLRAMSKGRVDVASMIVESETLPQVIACKEVCKKNCKDKCGEMDNANKNNPTELKGCESGCEKIHITEYSYLVRLKFNSPIFRSHSNFVEITPSSVEWSDGVHSLHLGGVERIVQDSKDSRFVRITLDSALQIGQELGTLSYKSKILSNTLKYPIKRLMVVLIAGILLWVLLVFCAKWVNAFEEKYPRILQASLLPPLSCRDRIFLSISGLLIFVLFVFQFWLGFPGFHIIGDTYNSIGLDKSNSHPVFISYILQFLYFLFGKHLYFLFLFNLVPFYAGLLFLVWGFYLRFRSVFALLLLLPLFVGNIYFQNFIEYHSFALPMLLFCGYAMVLFMLLVPLSGLRAKIMWCAIGIVFFFAILWRHNAIFSVYPVSLLLVYMWLCNRGFEIRVFVKKYIRGIVACAVLCLCVVIIVPRTLTIGSAYPANHPFLHQIAGACVPADDSSCFKDEWYYPNKGWEDIKAFYKKYPLNADPLNVPWGYDDERPIPYGKINGLYRQWAKSIIKYPLNFAKHELRFIKAMWIREPGWIFDAEALQVKATHPWYKQVISSFPESEQSIVLSPLKERIYTTLFNHKILFNHAWGVAISFGVMLLSFMLLVASKGSVLTRQILCFSFSVGFAGFFSALFYALFTPVAETRYMSPILPLGIIALIGFIAFVCDYYKNRDSNTIA